MKPSNTIKGMLLFTLFLLGALYLSTSPLSIAVEAGGQKPAVSSTQRHNPADYVGSDTCKACHADQFANFSRTIHAKLAGMASWKDSTVGCESCHGPGKQHVEGGRDITKIRNFKNEAPERISDVCLKCHAASDEQNNYRRGEHGRNNVGCISCHSPHGELDVPKPEAPPPSSQTYLSSVPPTLARVLVFGFIAGFGGKQNPGCKRNSSRALVRCSSYLLSNPPSQCSAPFARRLMVNYRLIDGVVDFLWIIWLLAMFWLLCHLFVGSVVRP
jgi:hypothetical protein